MLCICVQVCVCVDGMCLEDMINVFALWVVQPSVMVCEITPPPPTSFLPLFLPPSLSLQSHQDIALRSPLSVFIHKSVPWSRTIKSCVLAGLPGLITLTEALNNHAPHGIFPANRMQMTLLGRHRERYMGWSSGSWMVGVGWSGGGLQRDVERAAGAPSGGPLQLLLPQIQPEDRPAAG